MKRLIDKGLREAKMDIAIDNYVKERTSLEQSSHIAGVSLWKFLDELKTRNVALKYSHAEAEIEKTIRRRG